MSGTKMQWFKCKPDPFLSALAEMDADAQHVYAIVILKIYARGGPIRHDVRALSTFCRRSMKATQTALERLVEMGRLTIADGLISNPVAEEELAHREAVSSSRANAGRAGGEASGQSRRNHSPNSTFPNDKSVLAEQHKKVEEKAQQNQQTDEANASQTGSKTKQERSDKDKEEESSSLRACTHDRASYDQLEAALREAAGLQIDPSPSLADLSPILGLMDGGLDLERHILPALRAAAKSGKRGRSWRFYVGIITEAAQSRQKAAASVSRPHPVAVSGPPAISDEHWDHAAARFKRTGYWMLPRVCPPPDDPNTRVPAHILEKHGYGRAAA